MRKISVVSVVILCWGIFTGVLAQEHTENGKDQTLRGSGRVNSSTLGMEFDLPLGSYAGRGINVPISLSYSSKVWRMDNTGSYPVPAAGGTNRCVAGNVAKFGEHSAAGWTTSMRQASVEYTGYDERFNGEGFPMTTGMECIPPLSANNNNGSYIRRLQIHLPSGESHELRMDEQPLVYDRGESCPNPGDYLCANNPEVAANWNGWYYAADGSNLRYFEDRVNNVYFLQLPDGSKYSFNPSLESDENYKTIRKSPTYIDRNGNQTTYHQPDSQHPGFPHGYWTDTLGRILGVPLPQAAPASPVIQTYEMPGLNVQSPVIYKFHWKKLKGADADSSALSDFNQALKYLTDRDSYPGLPNPTLRDSNDTLFHSGWSDWAVSPNELFNPVLLTAIELPNGQLYRFSYNEYGEIVNIRYPTGGKENFTYTKIPALSAQQGDGNSNEESNRGVTSRKVYTSENGSSYYDWSYGAAHLNNMTEYKVTAINPDGTRSEKYLYRARQLRSQYHGSWGYSDNLGGMSYREESFNSLGQLVAKHLTVWTKSSAFVANTQITADYHPRVEREESISYDSAGNGVSTTTKSEYEGNLTQRETPLLTKKSLQYAFVPTGSPLPSLPLRSSESTFLINDANISPADRDAYKNQNIVGLATVSIVRDAAGVIVSQSEMRYDDSGYSPNIGRGNPTTARVWDSTKGAVTNPAAYIATRARFDSYGNQYEAIDAKGTSTFT